MKLKNVLIATKQTALEYYRQSYDDPKDVLPADLLEEKRREHEEHYSSFSLVKRVLENYNVPYQRVYMPYGSFEEFKGRDLVISLGGDGTVLNAAHYILDKTPLLTVKSEGDSVGALCKVNASTFENSIHSILLDDFDLAYWTRVQGKMGNKTDIALNDIAISQIYSNGMARYSIKYANFEEHQRSSRLIVSTGAGSTAWYSNIEYSKGSFDPTSKELRFAVSEDVKINNYKLKHGRLFSGDVLEITSLMDFNGSVSFDGDGAKRTHPFPIGQKLYVSISDSPLSVIIPR